MLELRGISKRFAEVKAVDGLSLEVRRGEVFGLLGPNGAGKSTTISIAMGLTTPDEGEARLSGGGDPADPRQRMRLGLAPQSLSIYDELSGEENLRFFGGIYGLHGAELRGRVEELLELTGLTDRRGSRAGTYSGGMKRRLNLAAALVHRPELILLDEPTAGVDPQSRLSIFELIERLRADGATIVYTTHYMEEAQRLCDRVGVVDHGRLLALDTVDALIAAHGGPGAIVYRTPEGERRRETEDPARDLPALLQTERILELRLERATLEDVFLNLTGRSLRD